MQSDQSDLTAMTDASFILCWHGQLLRAEGCSWFQAGVWRGQAHSCVSKGQPLSLLVDLVQICLLLPLLPFCDAPVSCVGLGVAREGYAVILWAENSLNLFSTCSRLFLQHICWCVLYSEGSSDLVYRSGSESKSMWPDQGALQLS